MRRWWLGEEGGGKKSDSRLLRWADAQIETESVQPIDVTRVVEKGTEKKQRGKRREAPGKSVRRGKEAIASQVR